MAKISNHGQIDAVIERFNVLSHSHELPQDAWEPREVKNPITGEKFYALTKKSAISCLLVALMWWNSQMARQLPLRVRY